MQLELAEADNAHLLASSLACLARPGNSIVNHDTQVQPPHTQLYEALASPHPR